MKDNSKINETAPSAELQNTFDKELHGVMIGGEVTVTREGKAYGRSISGNAVVSCLTDSLTGIISEKSDADQAREERLKEKYEVND